ncbi:MAG: polymer-forming cytoskeletal protein [Chloroflexi bacterium]|nr:polymer-forming cytoskeletal protein [Chloroflexota bacterium]
MTFFSRRHPSAKAEEENAEPLHLADETEEAAVADESAAAESKPSPISLAQPIGFATVLGPHSVMNGSLHCEANVRLDGNFSGEMNIGGNVLVGETARISADIHARNVSVAGAVRGNIQGRKVQLLRTSRVWGDIEATALSTEEGAFIDGKITMIRHEAAGIEAPEFDLPAEDASSSEETADPIPEAAEKEDPSHQDEKPTADSTKTDSSAAVSAETVPA